MTLLIKIPVQVNNDIDGFDTLAKIAADTMILVGQNIHLDFEDCIYFSGNLCAQSSADMQHSKVWEGICAANFIDVLL